MGFDKSYPNRKDHRRPYHGSKAFDASCRPGGDCPVCRQTKKRKRLKQAARIDARLEG
jgi:hypothetical protein